MEDREVMFRFPVQGRDYLCSKSLVYTASYLVNIGAKRPGREAHHASPFKIELKIAWAYTPISTRTI